MPNAKDAPLGSQRFLLIGHHGSGKTTQSLTMPKPAFAFLFDVKAVDSIRGFDIAYEEFIPATVDTQLRTVGTGVRPSANDTAATYERFNAFLRKFIQDGGSKKYKSIILDSLTSLQFLVSQAVLHDRQHDQLTPNRGLVKGEKGKQDDYMPVINTVAPAVAQLVFSGCHVLATAHVKENRDSEGKIQSYSLSALGSLRETIPSMFTHMFFTQAYGGDSQQVRYRAFTHATPLYPGLMTPFRFLPWDFDMTIKDFAKPEEYGLGAILAKAK